MANCGDLSRTSIMTVEVAEDDARDVAEGAGITIEVLQQHFHQPLVTVAEELGVSLTVSTI